MTTSRMLGGLLLLMAVVAAAAWWLTRPAPPFNLIIISLDDLRADRVGAYGYGRDTTPNLDAFARTALVFRDTHTQYTSTRDSHRAALSGRYPWRGWRPLLSELLSEAGYRTAAFTSGGFMNRRWGMAEGFEVYVDRYNYAEAGLTKLWPLARQWLQQEAPRPFYILLHTYDVHCPWDPPPPYRFAFLGERRPRFEIDGKCDNNYYNHIGMTPQDLQDLSAVYDGNLKWADRLLGEVLQELHALSLHTNTVIAIISDHGERLGDETPNIGHGELQEVEISVPMLIWVPGMEPQHVHEPAQLIDLVPTLLAALGQPLPSHVDGVNLLPYATGQRSFNGTRLRVTQGVRGDFAVRLDQRWKLQVSGEPLQVTALFDLQGDPGRDVLREHPQIAHTLLRRFLTELQPHGHPPPSTLNPAELDAELVRELQALGYIE